MTFHEMAAGRRGGKGGVLGGEDDFVHILLGCVEAAIDREGPGDVGGVAFNFAAGIDQYQRVVVEQLVVFDVMQHAGVGAAGDDGRVGVRVGAALPEFVSQFGFQLVLGHAGAAGAHGAGVAGAGDVGRALLDAGFGGVLDQAHAVKLGAQVVNGARCAFAGPGLGADFIQRLGDARVPCRIMANGVPQRVAVDEEFGQFLVELLDRVGGVEAEGGFGGFRAVAVAIPDFALFMLFAAEQDGFRFFAADQHDDRFRFREASQIPEVAVEAERVVRVAVADDFGCRRDDGDTVTDGFQQAFAAGDEVGVAHSVGIFLR